MENKPNSVDTITIDLTQPIESIWDNLSKTTQQQISEAEKEGLTFREVGFNDRELVRTVLTTLEDEKDIYLSKHLLNVRAPFLDGVRRMYVVEKEEPISASVITTTGGKFIYSLAGTTQTGKDIHASDFMVWNLIKDAKGHKVFHTFDFGGLYADWVEPNKLKVNEFKLRWGGIKVPISEPGYNRVF